MYISTEPVYNETPTQVATKNSSGTRKILLVIIIVLFAIGIYLRFEDYALGPEKFLDPFIGLLLGLILVITITILINISLGSWWRSRGKMPNWVLRIATVIFLLIASISINFILTTYVFDFMFSLKTDAYARGLSINNSNQIKISKVKSEIVIPFSALQAEPYVINDTYGKTLYYYKSESKSLVKLKNLDYGLQSVVMDPTKDKLVETYENDPGNKDVKIYDNQSNLWNISITDENVDLHLFFSTDGNKVVLTKKNPNNPDYNLGLQRDSVYIILDLAQGTTTYYSYNDFLKQARTLWPGQDVSKYSMLLEITTDSNSHNFKQDPDILVSSASDAVSVGTSQFLLFPSKNGDWNKENTLIYYDKTTGEKRTLLSSIYDITIDKLQVKYFGENPLTDKEFDLIYTLMRFFL